MGRAWPAQDRKPAVLAWCRARWTDVVLRGQVAGLRPRAPGPARAREAMHEILHSSASHASGARAPPIARTLHRPRGHAILGGNGQHCGGRRAVVLVSNAVATGSAMRTPPCAARVRGAGAAGCGTHAWGSCAGWRRGPAIEELRQMRDHSRASGPSRGVPGTAGRRGARKYLEGLGEAGHDASGQLGSDARLAHGGGSLERHRVHTTAGTVLLRCRADARSDDGMAYPRFIHAAARRPISSGTIRRNHFPEKSQGCPIPQNAPPPHARPRPCCTPLPPPQAASGGARRRSSPAPDCCAGAGARTCGLVQRPRLIRPARPAPRRPSRPRPAAPSAAPAVLLAHALPPSQAVAP
jgi:hypothetical protein